MRLRISRISRPRSVRARTALASGLAALALFGAGAWEMGNVAYHQRMDQTRLEAKNEAGDLVENVTLDSSGAGNEAGLLPFELDSTGMYLDSSSGMAPFEPRGDRDGFFNMPKTFMPLPGTGNLLTPFWGSAVATFPRVKDGGSLAGSTLSVETATLTLDDYARDEGQAQAAFDQHTGSPSNGLVRAYVFVTPDAARQAQTSLDRFSYPAVPAVALLIAALAYYITGRALRPVERIRARTAAVTASDPRERVIVPETGDEIAALAGTINDTLERLEKASRTQRRFVADAAHELRSPLATLLTTLEVAETYPQKADWPRTVAEAAHQTRRLQALTDDLLLLARLDAAPDASPVLDRLVDVADLAHDLAAHCPERAVEVTAVDGSGGRALVVGHPMQLERLLRNLVDNAVRYAHSGVEVCVAVAGEDVVLTVQDDGPGIAPDDRERVFDRFTRLDDARARDTGGSGLGLAIAREIAERHGGTLAVGESAHGARLVARLPLAAGSVRMEAPTRRSSRTTPRRPDR